MVRRLHLFAPPVVLVAAAVAGYVFRSELGHLVLVLGSGVLAWRVLLGQAGLRRRRRRRATWPEWIEALSFAWFAFGFRGSVRPKRDRSLSRRTLVELAADAKPVPRPAGGPSDEVPF